MPYRRGTITTTETQHTHIDSNVHLLVNEMIEYAGVIRAWQMVVNVIGEVRLQVGINSWITAVIRFLLKNRSTNKWISGLFFIL